VPLLTICLLAALGYALLLRAWLLATWDALVRTCVDLRQAKDVNDALADELEELRALNDALIERIAAQSEILSRRACKTSPPTPP